MKNPVTIFVVIIVISFRYAYNALRKGIHQDAFFVRLKLIHYGFDYFMIGILLCLLYDKKSNCHIRYFITCGIIFNFVVGLFEMRVLLINAYIFNSMITPLYSTIGFVLTCLILYYFICIKNKLLA